MTGVEGGGGWNCYNETLFWFFCPHVTKHRRKKGFTFFKNWKHTLLDVSSNLLKNHFSSFASKPINIRWIKMVLSHTEKSIIASYYRQFYTNKDKTSYNLKIVNFITRGKLYIIRCDIWLFKFPKTFTWKFLSLQETSILYHLFSFSLYYKILLV